MTFALDFALVFKLAGDLDEVRRLAPQFATFFAEEVIKPAGAFDPALAEALRGLRVPGAAPHPTPSLRSPKGEGTGVRPPSPSGRGAGGEGPPDDRAAWEQFEAELEAIALQHRDLRRWELTEAQADLLEQYLAGTQMLVECLKLAVVTDWEQVEGRLLLPGGGG